MPNRFTQLSQSSLRDLPHLQLPYQELDKLLASSQQQKTLADQMLATSPKYIQESEYASNAVKQLNQWQQSTKDRLAQIAATGDTRAYLSALSQVQDETARLYRPGGIAANLQEDYAAYQAHVVKEQERLAKGEIEPEVYQASVSEPLKNYDSAKGSKRYSAILRPQSVKFDDFANDFLKNYKDTDLAQKAGMYVLNGRLVYDESKITGVDAQKVLRDLSAAYAGAAGATGQLEDRFNIHNRDNKVVDNYKLNKEKEATKLLNSLNNIDLKDKKAVEELQKTLTKFGLDTGGIDGIAGAKTQEAIQTAKESANSVLEGLATIDDKELFSMAKQDYISSYIAGLVTPYASATGRQSATRKFTDLGETMAQWKQKKDYENEGKNLIVPIMPFSKAVPKDIKFYVKGAKLYKNTNASADALLERSKTITSGLPAFMLPGAVTQSVGQKIGSFLDRVFTSNDEADFSDPMLNNVRGHLATRVPGFENLDVSKQMEMVAKELDRQNRETVTGATFTANPDSKRKENYDKIYGAIKYDKDGKMQYDPGIIPNLKVQYRDQGIIKSGQSFLKDVKDGKFGKEANISFKGTVDNWQSGLPYGTIVMGVGDTEVYIEPDEVSKFSPETLKNAVWRSIVNTGVGNMVDFTYQGNQLISIYKPDKSIDILDAHTKKVVSQLQPVLNEQGQLINLVEKK